MPSLPAERTERHTVLPYGRHWIDDADIEAVEEVLRSDWLTTGPCVEQFERAFAGAVGAAEAVAVSSGTAALHAMMHAHDIGPGDEVIVPALTFAATANCVVFQGAMPVFADVDPATLLLDPADVERKLTPRTRCVIAVDYAGQPCDYGTLRALLAGRRIALVADACHALGATAAGKQVGSLAESSAFSLHPVKAITAGEGGVVTTDDGERAGKMRVFRNHGITTDHRQRAERGSWTYEMVTLGYNYRLSDLQCALALSQLRKLSAWTARRREIARRYDAAFAHLPSVRPLAVRPAVEHAYHLYVVRLARGAGAPDRATVFRRLRARRIGTNVHYLPVYLHPFYRGRYGTAPGLCPRAEQAYEEILSLPIFPRMTNHEVDDVIGAVAQECGA